MSVFSKIEKICGLLKFLQCFYDGMLKAGRCYLDPVGLVYNIVDDSFSVVCSSSIDDITVGLIVSPWADVSVCEIKEH